MRLKLVLALFVCVFVVPGTLLAQDDGPFVFATYYQCDQNMEERADEIVADVIGPIYDQHLADGTISAWGWSTHNIGGHWRRLAYMVAPDVDSLLAARGQVIQSLTGEHAEVTEEFTDICPDHDDYIWSVVAQSEGMPVTGGNRPAVGVSTYYVCNMGLEGQADEILEEQFAPILEENVSDGGIVGWSWLAHAIGGEYRRILVLDGNDASSLMNAWGDLVNDLNEKQPVATQKFNKICASHIDMLWDLQISRPGPDEESD